MKTGISAFLLKYFDTIETVCAIGFSAGMILLIQQIKFAPEVLWVSLIALALLYWFAAIAPTESKESNFELFFRKIKWIGFALAVIGILLRLQFSDKSYQLLAIGGVMCLIIIALHYYRAMKLKNRTDHKSGLIRAFILGFISLYLFAL